MLFNANMKRETDKPNFPHNKSLESTCIWDEKSLGQMVDFSGNCNFCLLELIFWSLCKVSLQWLL